jgi:dihydrofolate reductase
MKVAQPAVSLIVAMDQERVIGRDGQLPWHLPNDLQRFKSLTMSKPIIMGRRTHLSIGRALPGRRNIVLTRSRDLHAPGCEQFSSLDAALSSIDAPGEAFIIGGAGLYREALPRATRIYLTLVDAHVGGDVVFPELLPLEWQQTLDATHCADDRHAYDYKFLVLQRVAVPSGV